MKEGGYERAKHEFEMIKEMKPDSTQAKLKSMIACFSNTAASTTFLRLGISIDVQTRKSGFSTYQETIGRNILVKWKKGSYCYPKNGFSMLMMQKSKGKRLEVNQ